MSRSWTGLALLACFVRVRNPLGCNSGGRASHLGETCPLVSSPGTRLGEAGPADRQRSPGRHDLRRRRQGADPVQRRQPLDRRRKGHRRLPGVRRPVHRIRRRRQATAPSRIVPAGAGHRPRGPRDPLSRATGTTYRRTYFSSHPAQVMVLRFTADKKAAYIGHDHAGRRARGEGRGRGQPDHRRRVAGRATSTAAAAPAGGRTHTTSRSQYEAQLLVLHEGGTLEAVRGRHLASRTATA